MANNSDSAAKPTSFYGDMEKLLQQQLAAEPASRDLRLKLIELYFETNRPNEFLREAAVISRDIRDKPKSKEWQRVESMGRMLVPHADLFRVAVSDSIEFIGQPAIDQRQKTKKRFGEAHAQYFEKLAKDYEAVRTDPKFLAELDMQLVHVANRPSSMLHAARLSQAGGGAQIFFKREDLSPAGTHLTISIVGQALLARRLGRKTLVTASSNGLRGVITASVAARMGLKAIIFMDGQDAHLQSSNVFRIWLMGGTVNSVDPHTYHKGDVRETALGHCAQDPDSFLVMGLDAAPHPYPMMGLEFSAVIGRECRRQISGQPSRMASLLVARAGDNADAIGFFQSFLPEKNTRLVCVQPRSEFTKKPDPNSKPDPFQTSMTSSERHVASVIMEGLEYPSVIREHAWLKASGRVEYVEISEEAVKHVITECGRYEGLIPPIQTAHAIAWAYQEARTMQPSQNVVVILRESMDKDIWEIAKGMGIPL